MSVATISPGPLTLKRRTSLVRGTRTPSSSRTRAVTKQRSLPFVVTLAMAAAEVGDFPRALEWQQAAIGAVRNSGNVELLPELEDNLARYRNGSPCRVPWREDSPMLSPRPAR